MKHEHYSLRSSPQKKNIFMNSLALLDHIAVNSVLYLSLIFIYRKGGALLHDLPFRHSRWFYFQLKIFELVTDVLIPLTEKG